MFSDDKQWQQPDNSATDSASGWSLFQSSPAPSTVPIETAALPPVCLLLLYNLEYQHLIAKGEVSRAIEQQLQQHGASGRQYVVSIGSVDVERAAQTDVNAALQQSACCSSENSVNGCCA